MTVKIWPNSTVPNARHCEITFDGHDVFDDFSREMITVALRASNGNISACARLLGVSRYAVMYQLRKHYGKDWRNNFMYTKIQNATLHGVMKK